jgi:hypothetical protein
MEQTVTGHVADDDVAPSAVIIGASLDHLNLNFATPKSAFAGSPFQGSGGDRFPCCSTEDVAMTVKTYSEFLSSPSGSEAARLVSRLMTPIEPNQPPTYGRLFQEADQRPQEPPPFRWPRVFPGL